MLVSNFIFVYSKMFFFNLFFIEVWLIYNVVLVSGVQQSDSVTRMYTFFSYSFPLWFITGC